MTITLLLLLMPAVGLCVSVTAIACYFGAVTKGDKKAIHAGIIRYFPFALILNHTIVFVVLLATMRGQGIGLWSIGLGIAAGKDLLLEIFVGVLAALTSYCAGRFLFTPLSRLMQERFGGYQIDKGERDVKYWLVWLLAVGVFAAVVEETVYRGYALHELTPAVGAAGAVVISSILFGLLHWAYGWWRMATTVVYGILFALLFLWRQSLVAPIIAHGLHNLISTIVKQKARTS